MSRRLVLFLGLLCAFALLASSFMRRGDELQLGEMARASTRERARTTRALVTTGTTRTQGYLAVQGAWNELAAHIAKPTPGWMGRNLVGMWPHYGISAIYIYNARGKLVDRLVPHATKLRTWHPGREARIPSLVGRNRSFRSFYARTPAGLAQVSLMSVTTNGDEARRKAARGYLVVVRLWNSKATAGLAKITATRVEVIPWAEANRRAAVSSAERFNWFEELRDAKGRVTAVRHYSANSPVLAQYGIALLRNQAFVVILIVGLLATLGIFVGYFVGRPLRQMALAVTEGNTTRIGPLMEDLTEIGTQARLIESWFLMRNELINTNEWLEREVRDRTRELNDAYTGTIRALVTALDYRDQETKGHCERVTEMAETIARFFRLSEIEIDDLRRGALLHDIGKIAIPDAVLLKPGALTIPERAMMETHAEIGYDMLKEIRFLERALEIPRCHHEKWDGTGYPEGLAGEDIPLAARIFSLVDVWDALSTTRPYRRAWAPEVVRAHIIEGAGTHFDPMVVAAFERLPLTAFPSEYTEDLAA